MSRSPAEKKTHSDWTFSNRICQNSELKSHLGHNVQHNPWEYSIASFHFVIYNMWLSYWKTPACLRALHKGEQQNGNDYKALNAGANMRLCECVFDSPEWL